MSSPTPPPDGSGQRLAGFSHAELYRMAHGGDPEAAGRAGRRLARVAETLRGVSTGLERAAAGAGPGWIGQASQAAQGGIGAHAAWARNAGQQAAQAGTAAAEQAASARNVIAQMPPPAVTPRGGSPVAVNVAQVEQAQDNARLRAVELMRGHAEVSARARPAGTFTPPPGAPGPGPAGVPAGRPAAAGRAPAGLTRPAGARAVPAAGSGSPSAAAASRVGATPAPARGAGPVAGTGRSVAAGVPPAVAGPARRGPVAGPVRTATGPAPRGSAGATVSASGPVGRGGGAPGRSGPTVADAPVAPAAGPTAREPMRSGGGPGTRRTHPAARSEQPGTPAEPPAAWVERPGPRGGEQPLPDRHPDGTRPPGAGGGQGPAGHGLTAPGVPGGVAPPMAGPAGAWWPEHERLGYLLDDQGLFDGDDPVAPPVLGGRAARPDPPTPWETRCPAPRSTAGPAGPRGGC